MCMACPKIECVLWHQLWALAGVCVCVCAVTNLTYITKHHHVPLHTDTQIVAL